MPPMFVTEETSQLNVFEFTPEASPLLKLDEPNIRFIFVTFEVSHDPKS